MSAIPESYRIDPGPMVAWLTERAYAFELKVGAVNADALGSAAHLTPQQRLLRLLGWEGETGARRLHRWLNEATVIDRRDVEETLHTAGVDWFDVYPAPEDASDEGDVDEEFCFACRAFVTPIDSCCAWCDRPVQRIDLRNLPPRPVEKAPPEPTPLMRVKHTPRQKMPPKPFYLDVALNARREALEVFAGAGSILEASATLVPRYFASVESAAGSVRRLLEREGWWERPGRSPRAREAAARAAQRAVRDALERGTWDRIVEQQPLPSQRRIFDEWLVRDAAFMYFVDESSFAEIARRLKPRCATDNEHSITTALIDEWNRRGWPRRTGAPRRWRGPSRKQRCRARTASGALCRKWARAGERFCQGHDPDVSEERRRLAAQASAAASPDAVPVEPFAYWLRHRRRELGSLKAVHHRVEGAISYDSLADWCKPWGEVGTGRGKVIRRSTIDRILATWGDGTTFEDIYMPVESDDRVLVPEATAA